MTKKIKTPKPPYAYTTADRWILVGINIALLLSLILGNIFANPYFLTLFIGLLVAEFLFIVGTILNVVDHTNRRVVDLTERIESVEHVERPTHGIPVTLTDETVGQP